MHSHRPDRAGYPFLSICVAEQSLGDSRPACRKRRNGRAGAAQAEADHIRMPHSEQAMQTGHEAFAIWLVHPIAQRLSKLLLVTGRQRSKEQRQMLQVEHSIG